MLTKQHTEPGRADMQRSPLRAKVAEHDTGNADIALNQRMQGRIGRAAIEQLERRDAQPFLENVG